MSDLILNVHKALVIEICKWKLPCHYTSAFYKCLHTLLLQEDS